MPVIDLCFVHVFYITNCHLGGGEDIFVFVCVFIFVTVNSAVSSRAVDFLKRPVIYKTLLAHSFRLNFNVCLMFVQ